MNTKSSATSADCGGTSRRNSFLVPPIAERKGSYLFSLLQCVSSVYLPTAAALDPLCIRFFGRFRPVLSPLPPAYPTRCRLFCNIVQTSLRHINAGYAELSLIMQRSVAAHSPFALIPFASGIVIPRYFQEICLPKRESTSEGVMLTAPNKPALL